MTHRKSGYHRFIGSATIGILILAYSAATYAEESRIWTDSTGRHQTNATFVRVDSSNVHLKLASGRVVVVPLTRLSDADREYVSRLPKPAAPKPAHDALLTTIKNASVVVWSKHGERALPTPGIVAYQRDGQAYVLARGLSLSFAPRNQPQPTYEVAAGEKRVPAEWKAERFGVAASLLSAPADELPQPIALAKAASAEEGQTVHVFGFNATKGIPPSVTPYEQSGMIHRVFRTLEGEIASVRVELSSVPPDMSLVANDAGQLVGVLRSSNVDPRRTSRSSGPPPRFFIIYPVNGFFESLSRPLHKHTFFALKDKGSDKRTFQFVVFASDPFEQIRNPRLYLSPYTKTSLTSLPSTETGVLDSNKHTLALAAKAPDEKLVDALQVRSEVERQATFVGDFETQLGGDPDFKGFHVQFVYETPDGQTQLGNKQTLIPVTIRRR